MTELRQRMLEELQRRNFSSSTIRGYIRTVRDFAAHFRKPPDQLGVEQVRRFQLHMLRDQKLASFPAPPERCRQPVGADHHTRIQAEVC